MRSNASYEPGDLAEDVAVAVVQGLRGAGDRFVAELAVRKIPTLVVDLGWLRRERSYWQVCPGGLNVPPPSAPSTDRFRALDLKIFPKLESKPRDSICVFGQLPGDKQHDLTTAQQVLDWGRSVASEAHALFPRRRVLWRPHPLALTRLGPPAVQTAPDRQLNQLVRDDFVSGAIVYNSSAGIDLLRLGVNVVAQGPRTVYTDLVSTSVSDVGTSHPGPVAVEELLSRLAYGQYKTEELSSWSTLASLLELHGIDGDW